jgi:DNA-binding IclR family transcriptional regulator
MPASPNLRLVERAFDVLDVLATNGELTIAQIAERTGEPRSSLYRLIATLERLSIVEPGVAKGAYRLGPHIMRLGASAVNNIDVRTRALPSMQRLREATGLTVYLCVKRGWNAVCIERVEGSRVSSLALRVGASQPLHAGAAPRALLAYESTELWDSYLSHGELARLTSKTPADPDRLLEVLRRERKNGYTLSDGDVTPGIAAVGAVVVDYHGHSQGAVSVSGLREDVLGGNRQRTIALVRETARAISQAMGSSD